MCRLFMDFIDDPFKSITNLLELIKSKINDCIILIDIHGESTSEKMAIAHFLDGKVSGILELIHISQHQTFIYLKKEPFIKQI